MSPSWPSCVRRYGTFCAADRDEFGWSPAVDSWLGGWDAEFSARLGDAGFVGLTIPHRVRRPRAWTPAPLRRDRGAAGPRCSGGRALDRRPPGRSWACWRTATRSSGSVCCHASPPGRFYSSIGMSEHGAGSDLAAVQTQGDQRRRAAGCSTAPRCGPAARIWRIRSSCWPAPARQIPSIGTPGSVSSWCRCDADGVAIESDRADVR